MTFWDFYRQRPHAFLDFLRAPVGIPLSIFSRESGMRKLQVSEEAQAYYLLWSAACFPERLLLVVTPKWQMRCLVSIAAHRWQEGAPETYRRRLEFCNEGIACVSAEHLCVAQTSSGTLGTSIPGSVDLLVPDWPAIPAPHRQYMSFWENRPGTSSTLIWPR